MRADSVLGQFVAVLSRRSRAFTAPTPPCPGNGGLRADSVLGRFVAVVSRRTPAFTDQPDPAVGEKSAAVADGASPQIRQLPDQSTASDTAVVAGGPDSLQAVPWHGQAGQAPTADRSGSAQMPGQQATNRAVAVVSDDRQAVAARSTVVAQGLGEAERNPQAASTDRTRNVLVVHGRDEEVRHAMFSLLRSLGLSPLEWEDLVRASGKASPLLGEVVANAPSRAQAALVLLTPDDTATLHPQLHGENEPDYETQPTGQPRQNVLIELGMVLMAYPQRTLVVEVGRLRQGADTVGLNVVRFDGTSASVAKIIKRLKQAGCQVDDTGSVWQDTQLFQHLSASWRET
ncbi:TIR domain-containing protein [Streptomyces sp. NPDC053069]|uniref:TIR domain-containing protein n=1 Tax=Streptomyces sp. NPDC053069 TaxID=3365695 RepID=UPI0037D548B9